MINWKDLEGSGRRLIEAFFHHLPARTEKKPAKNLPGYTILDRDSKDAPSEKSIKLYRYVSPSCQFEREY